MEREYLDKVPKGTKFFHPLPRNASFPDIPFWLDQTEYNGWDQQSQNGYFTRIVLLGMLGGQFGEDFDPETTPRGRMIKQKDSAPPSPMKEQFAPVLRVAGDFVTEVDMTGNDKDSGSFEVGLQPIQRGIIVDRLAQGQSIERIWAIMYMVRSVLGLNCLGGMVCISLKVARTRRPALSRSQTLTSTSGTACHSR